jgi:hypothetical protein
MGLTQDVQPPFFRCCATAAAAVFIVCLLVLVRPPPACSMMRCCCCGGDCDRAGGKLMPSIPPSLTGDAGPTRQQGTLPVLPALLPSLAREGEGGASSSGTTALRPACVLGVVGRMEGDGCASVDVTIVLSRGCKKLGESGKNATINCKRGRSRRRVVGGRRRGMVALLSSSSSSPQDDDVGQREGSGDTRLST